MLRLDRKATTGIQVVAGSLEAEVCAPRRSGPGKPSHTRWCLWQKVTRAGCCWSRCGLSHAQSASRRWVRSILIPMSAVHSVACHSSSDLPCVLPRGNGHQAVPVCSALENSSRGHSEPGRGSGRRLPAINGARFTYPNSLDAKLLALTGDASSHRFTG
jgi:hypothetical protein